MAVSVTSPQVTYVGNGITTEYPFGFTILKATDLRVFVEDVLKTLDTHYTLDNNFTTVTFVTAPLNLDDVVIERNTQIERTTDYIEGGGLHSDTLDNDFDRVVMMIQEQETLGTSGNSGTGISTDAGGNIIVNVGDPVNLQDAATKNYVDTATPEISWQSDSYNIDTHQGWKLDPATGSAIFHSLSVRNSSGQLVFDVGGLDWGYVTGTGRPEDNSTAGATVGVNFNGQFNSGNISTYFASAAIGYAQIGSVKLTGNNFTVNEGVTTSGITMDGNAIKVYDALGNLRVKLGNLLI